MAMLIRAYGAVRVELGDAHFERHPDTPAPERGRRAAHLKARSSGPSLGRSLHARAAEARASEAQTAKKCESDWLYGFLIGYLMSGMSRPQS